MIKSVPSTRSANLLYLLTSLLTITAGAYIQSKALSLGLIATEGFLILLPALLFIRLGKLPVRDTLRLRRPPLRLAILAMLIAAGVWPLSLLLNSVSTLLFHYTPPTPAGFAPTNLWEALLLFLGLAVAAPLCEEVVWRGYIQRAYDSRGPWVSVGLVSLFFAFWHLRLQGFLALLPLALMLGFLAWRSNSLLPGILAHFVANGLQVLVITLTSLGLVSNTVLGIAILLGALAGLPLAGVGIFLFWKWTPTAGPTANGKVEEPPALPAPRPVSAWVRLATLLPLLGAAAIFIYSAWWEVKTATDPNALAAATRDTLQYDAAPWTRPAVWEYQIRNIIDQPVGTQTCTLSPSETFVDLACTGAHQAYQVEYHGGTFMGGAGQSHTDFRWDRQTLGLVASGTVFQWDAGPQPARSGVTRQGEQLVLTGTDAQNQPHQLTLPGKFLLDGEWPYRLSGLAFGRFKNGTTVIAWPSHYVGQIKSDRPLTHPAGITVRGPEKVSVPAGDFQAYRVELSITGTNERQTAWYDVNEPHTLVKYDNSFETYLLISIR
jgi:membrane protease YdiL (CAAX protease family)